MNEELDKFYESFSRMTDEEKAAVREKLNAPTEPKTPEKENVQEAQPKEDETKPVEQEPKQTVVEQEPQAQPSEAQKTIDSVNNGRIDELFDLVKAMEVKYNAFFENLQKEKEAKKDEVKPVGASPSPNTGMAKEPQSSYNETYNKYFEK